MWMACSATPRKKLPPPTTIAIWQPVRATSAISLAMAREGASVVIDYHGDVGPVGAIFVGILAGGVTLVAGQYVFAFARSTWIRVAVALLFAAPAALAGYHATLGLAKLTMPSGAWQIAISIVGAVAVGVTAWTRMALPPVHPAQGIVRG